MLTHNIKKIILLFLILFLIFNTKVLAEPVDITDSIEPLENTTNETNSSVENEPTIPASNEPNSKDDAIYNFTTVSTLPEANLGLNNILNIILITIRYIDNFIKFSNTYTIKKL